MDAQPFDFAPVRYSTDDLPERDRLSAWREFVGPRIFSTEIEPIDAPYRGEVTVRQLPGVALMSASCSPTRFSRHARLLADGRDDLGLQVNLSARGTVMQRGEETTYEPGEAVFLNVSVPSANTSPHPSRYWLLFVRPEDLAPFVPGFEDAPLRRVPANAQALQYLLSYTRFLEGERNLADPELARAASTHLRDLFALALGASRDAVFIAEGRGLRAARLQAIKRYVVDHLGDVRLSVNEVAARHHVTPRYVQRLFEREGTTFSEYVLNTRLEHVRDMLRDPRCADRNVGTIALAAGFGDISYFNRCFRRRYGASPTEIRHSSARR